MNKDIPPKGRPLSKEEMLQRHSRRDYQDIRNELNDFSRRALSGLQYYPEDKNLEATLKRLERKASYSTGHGRRFILPRILSMVAALALLVAAGYFLFLQPADNEALFAQHFSYLPSAVELQSGGRAETEATTTQRANAIQAYEAGNYEQAKFLMESYLHESPSDTEIQFYLAIILLGEEKSGQAISHLEATLQALPRPAYERPARWYLALALLHNGQAERAEKLFLELRDGKDRYAAASHAILKQL